MINIHDRLAGYMPEHKPEAVSVLVVANNPVVAGIVAPYVARELYPGRAFGETLYVEWVGGEKPGYECAVEVR